MGRCYGPLEQGAGFIVKFALIAAAFLPTARSRAVEVPLLLQQSPSGGGVVIPSPGVHRFTLNAQITLTAIPHPGYEFIYWLGDVVDPRANRTQAFVDKPKIIVAVFGPTQYQTLSAGADEAAAGGGGRLVGGGFLTAASDFVRPRPIRIQGGSATPQSSWSGGFSFVFELPSESETDSGQSTQPEPPIPEPATALLLLMGSWFLHLGGKGHSRTQSRSRGYEERLTQ
jgi:hypothetical protein